MAAAFHRWLALATVVTIALVATSAWGKRLAPADVAPVTSANLRFEAPHSNNPCGQNGGCVVAYDHATNTVLWSVKLYCTQYDKDLEQDVQDVFITSLTVENGQVVIADEQGRHFSLDPATQRISGDAGGCGGDGASGCNYQPVRSTPNAKWLVSLLAVLGLAGMGFARSRRARSEKAGRSTP
jgi:outer membrane protein assembly factor BamB